MLPDRVSNPRPLTYESGALPIALRGPAKVQTPTLISVIVLTMEEFDLIILLYVLKMQMEWQTV